MAEMLAFINLFFTPMVCIYLIYRRAGRAMAASAELLVQYGVAVSCNIPMTKVFVFLVRTFFAREIGVDSGYYTVVALVAAILLAWFSAIFRIEIVSEKEG